MSNSIQISYAKHGDVTGRETETSRQIIDCLASSYPSPIHCRPLPQHHPGTCTWFLESESFGRWMVNSPSFLWLQGRPGSGKTIVSAAVVEYLQEYGKSNQRVLYFFFDFTDQDRSSIEGLVRSLIVQIYHGLHEVDNLRSSSFTGNGVHQQHDLKSLTDILSTLMNQLDEVAIILDGLDESQDKQAVLIWVEALLHGRHPNVHVLVASRVDDTIDSSIRKYHTDEEIVALESEEIGTGIRTYIETRVKEGRASRKWAAQPGLQENIVDVVVKKSDGTFRLASCHLDELEKCSGRTTLERALSNLPTTLGETYTRILASIPEEHRQNAIVILNLILWSDRHLSLDEVADALATQPGKKPGFDARNRLFDPMDILQLCAGLVGLVKRSDNGAEMMGRSSNIQLAHFSIKEYLKSPDVTQPFGEEVREHKARAVIAKLCLSYLSSIDHSLPLDAVRKQFPFSQYCARYWMEHARVAESEDELLQQQIMDFFADRMAYATCYSLFDPDEPWQEMRRDRTTKIADPLYYASLGGLLHTTKLLTEQDTHVDARGAKLGNFSQASLNGGYDGVIDDFIAWDERMRRTTDVLAEFCYPRYHHIKEGIVGILLEAGANPNLSSGPHGNALQIAAASGHEGVVRTLLEFDANAYLPDAAGRTPLHLAASSGSLNIVRLLLDRGADAMLEQPDSQCFTALDVAFEHGFEEIVDLLLERGARFTGYLNGLRKTKIDEMLRSRLMKICSELYETNITLTDELKAKSFGQACRIEVLDISLERKTERLDINHDIPHTERLLIQKSPSRVFRKSFHSNADEDARRRLARERRLLEHLHHPNIVSFLGFDILDEEPTGESLLYLYLEFCEGGDLSRHVRPSEISDESDDDSVQGASLTSNPIDIEQLSLELAWSICEDLASALAYCHHGVELTVDSNFKRSYSLAYSWLDPVLHRDIKPENIVCTYASGRRVTKLCDLGCSRFKESEGSHTRNFGTPGFIPPELFTGGPYTAKGDVYALGETLSMLAIREQSPTWTKLIEECKSLEPTKRPSSLVILQIAREELKRVPPPSSNDSKLTFLPDATPGLSYIEQAVCENFKRCSKLLKRGLKGEQPAIMFTQIARRIQTLLHEARPQDIEHFSMEDWHLLSSACPTNAAVVSPERYSENPLFPSETLGLTASHLAASVKAGHSQWKKALKKGS